MVKKITSIVMVVTMVMGLSVSAFANEFEGKKIEKTSPTSNTKVMTFTFGEDG